MAYKIAVASSDGKVVNQHFGRSRQFLIFEVSDQEEYTFAEVRESEPPCGIGEHDEDMLQKAVELLGDCRFVLVSQIGPGAEHALRSKGVKPFAVADFIDKALERLVRFAAKSK